MVTTQAETASSRTPLQPDNSSIPALLQSYMRLSKRVMFGETVIDQKFGNALEIAVVGDGSIKRFS